MAKPTAITAGTVGAISLFAATVLANVQAPMLPIQFTGTFITAATSLAAFSFLVASVAMLIIFKNDLEAIIMRLKAYLFTSNLEKILKENVKKHIDPPFNPAILWVKGSEDVKSYVTNDLYADNALTKKSGVDEAGNICNIKMPYQFSLDFPRLARFNLNGQLAYSCKSSLGKNNYFEAYKKFIQLCTRGNSREEIKTGKWAAERVARSICQTSLVQISVKLGATFPSNKNLSFVSGKDSIYNVDFRENDIIVEIKQAMSLADNKDPTRVFGYSIVKRKIIFPYNELTAVDWDISDDRLPNLKVEDTFTPLMSEDLCKRIFDKF